MARLGDEIFDYDGEFDDLRDIDLQELLTEFDLMDDGEPSDADLREMEALARELEARWEEDQRELEAQIDLEIDEWRRNRDATD